MRLKRRGLLQGYIKVPEASKNGKQHLHVLFRGEYIEQALISHWWQQLHHAKVVDIRKAWRGRGGRGLASYMAKYMSKENIYRYSWNWGWVWRGFCRDWNKLKRLVAAFEGERNYRYMTVLKKLWRLWLQGKWQPDFDLLPEAP